MAEGVFRSRAAKLGLSIAFDSCGTGGWHVGEAPDHRAQQCMKNHGDDISDLRARQFGLDDFEAFDLIYTMDISNYNNVLAMAENEGHRAKVKLILNEVSPNQNQSVPDPYFGDGDGFEHVYDLLSRAAVKVLNQWKQ